MQPFVRKTRKRMFNGRNRRRAATKLVAAGLAAASALAAVMLAGPV